MPKYLALTQWINEQISQGELRIGDKLMSENELRKKFAVSRQTVRQAASILENEGILERRRGSGTYIAAIQPTRQRQTMQVGVITTYLDDYIFPGIIKGIEQVLTQYGYNMQIAITYNKAENEMRILEKILSQDVDGLIIEPTKSGLPNLNSRLYEKLQSRRIPVVFINGYYQNNLYPYIAMDDMACGRSAADYLLQKGHTKIAGLFKLDDIQGHLRYAGASETLQHQDILLSEDNIVWYTTEDLKDELNGSFAERVLERIKGCTAVICYNDQIAARIIKILAVNNIQVPDDISLISFDNSDLGVSVPLTTFVHPKEELGKTAAKNILRLIKKENFDANYKFPPLLIEGNSVKAL